MQENNPAASAAKDIKAAARDALRVGSQWAHHALQWIDERSQQMNNRNREQEQRELAKRNRYSTSGYGSDEGDYASAQGASRVPGGRRGQDDDRDMQDDYSAGAGSSGGRQQEYGREGSYPQSRYAQPRRSPPTDAQSSSGQEGRSQYDNSAQYSGAQHSHQGGREYGGSGNNQPFDRQEASRDFSRSTGYGRERHESWQQSRHERQGQSQFDSARYGSTGGGYRGVGPKNYTRSDERIREDLNERLTDSDEIDASGITVEVSNGVATLAGTVDQRWMKHRAEDIADACSGVRDVNNQIKLRPSTGQSDYQSASRTQDARGAAPHAGSSASSPTVPGASGPAGLGTSSTPGSQASGSNRPASGQASSAGLGASSGSGSSGYANSSGGADTQGQQGIPSSGPAGRTSGSSGPTSS